VNVKSPERTHLLFHFFPFLKWFRNYSLSALGSDAQAGLTVAVILIPQAMAYAMLAGLPPVYGLYSAAVTPFISGLWGSLRQLATGPIAIMSLLVLTTLGAYAQPGSPEYIGLATLLAFMVGLLYLFIGLLRMGMVMSFISHSCVKGFTAAAALIIIATQLPHFLGISVSRHEYIFPMMAEIIRNIPECNPYTTLVGILSFAIILLVRKFYQTLPAGLIALVIATGILIIFELEQFGVGIIGKVPEGLPGFAFPPFSFEMFSRLAGSTVVIALVSFAETYSVGKSISAQTKQKVDVNQEFIGQGMANLIGSFFQSYPVSGSFSRTAINYAAGAKSGVSGIFASILVILSLLFLTSLFTYIPRAALAALVISAVLLLFHPKEVFRLWKMNRHDGIVAITVFVMGLVSKPDYALLIGVMISLIFFLWKTMHPRIVCISKDPKLNMFLNADSHKLPVCPQMLHLRLDSEVYFGNAQFLAEHILKCLDEQEGPVKFLLLDFHSVAFIDITGIDELGVLLDDATLRGVRLAFMGIHEPVGSVFRSSGFIQEIESHLIFEKRGDAISSLFSYLNHDYCKNTCPHRIFGECFTIKPE
jgi:SulP family sulfate permease